MSVPKKILRRLSQGIPDEAYLRMLYCCKMRRKLHLHPPVTFTEKLQWLKLYDRNPLYTKLADKYAVKAYVAEKVGEAHIVPTLGLWERPEDMDFSALPRQFVLKCTHDSNSVILCRDKEKLDKAAACRRLKEKLQENYYYFGREWPYKDVPPRILCETYLEDEIKNYKFFCFYGRPRFLYVSVGLGKDVRMFFCDMDWNRLPFRNTAYGPLDASLEKPACFAEMAAMVEILSAGIPFVRIDLFAVAGHVYFSEYTFTPTSGFMVFDPPEYDKILGDYLPLPPAGEEKPG